MSNISRDNITLSTAAFCLWNIQIEEKLEHCHLLGFSNVQIALSTVKMIKDFTVSINHLPQLMKFNDVSIHAPWCGVKYGKNTNTIQILEYLKLIDDHIPVSRFVFNFDSILDIDVLYNSGLNIIIRNPVKPDSWHKFKSAIHEKKIPSVLDLNKAERNNYPINAMIDEIAETVAEIHVSGFTKGKNRMPVVSTKQEYLLKHLEKFKAVETPIVIEGLFMPMDFQSINEEKKLIMNHIIQGQHLS